MLDMGTMREAFEASTDFTVGSRRSSRSWIRSTLSLDHRFEELGRPREADAVLAESVAGELITVRDRDPLRARRDLRRRGRPPARGARAPVRAGRRRNDALLGATGTHPWSPWQEQRIIDTEHYRRVEERAPVRGLAQQHLQRCTCTWGCAGRIGRCAVCDRLRPCCPSCWRCRPTRRSSTGATPGLHSARTPDLHQELPALRHPRRVRGLARRTRTTSTSSCGRTRSSSTRRSGGACGRTTRSARSRCASATRRPAPRTPRALAALITACVAQAALDYDEGVPFDDPPGRADRGELLAGDPPRARRQADRPRPAARSIRRRRARDRLWPGPRRRAALLGIERRPAEENGAQRQQRALAGGSLDRGRLSPPRWRHAAHLRGRGGGAVSEPQPEPRGATAEAMTQIRRRTWCCRPRRRW